MNKDNFLSLSSKERVAYINDLLKNKSLSLQEIADQLQISHSSLTKLLQQDDYVYIKRDNSYFKFIRDESQIKTDSTVEDEVTLFLKENFEQLKAIVAKHNSNDDFTIDKSIFKSTAKQSVKTFRIPEDLYQKFVETCEKEFPHLKLQDIITQLLVDFTNKYDRNDI